MTRVRNLWALNIPNHGIFQSFGSGLAHRCRNRVIQKEFYTGSCNDFKLNNPFPEGGDIKISTNGGVT